MLRDQPYAGLIAPLAALAPRGSRLVAADLYEVCGMLAGFGLASRGGVGRSGSVAACRLWAGSK
jgi:hypothetical protein